MTQDFAARPHLPDPRTAPELFEGLFTRRISAHIIDLVLIAIITMALGIAALLLGFLTFGLAWMALAFIVPGSAILYYAVTLGSHRRATVGMRMMDIVLTPARGEAPMEWMGVVHAVLFWATVWVLWPLALLVPLFTPRRQMLHDLLIGGLMVRRSPMERHWSRMRHHEGF